MNWPTITTWKGKPISDCDREELLACIEWSAWMNQQLQDHQNKTQQIKIAAFEASLGTLSAPKNNALFDWLKKK